MTGRPKKRARGGAKAPLVSRPPFEPGNQAARTHGYWAKVDDTELLATVDDLYGHQPDLIDRYPAIAAMGAGIWIRRRRALADIDKRGMVITDHAGDERPHPLLEHVDRCERRLLELSRRYGLDPRSDAELTRHRAGAVAAGFDLDALRARGRETLDARTADTPDEPEQP